MPICRTSPPPGPFPSMQSTASSRVICGATAWLRSMSRSLNASMVGLRQCHSGFLRPGMQPKRFLTPAVITVSPWVLSLAQLMM